MTEDVISKSNLAHLFDLAIAGERVAEKIYRGLAVKFAHHPEVAAFWEMYAEEEIEHALNLRRIRDGLSAETLSAPADLQMVDAARHVAELPTSRTLQKIQTLEDAYTLAEEAESGETNAIFDFLIENFSDDENVRAFLRKQLSGHITHLTERFPSAYRGKSSRESVNALE